MTTREKRKIKVSEGEFEVELISFDLKEGKQVCAVDNDSGPLSSWAFQPCSCNNPRTPVFNIAAHKQD